MDVLWRRPRRVSGAWIGIGGRSVSNLQPTLEKLGKARRVLGRACGEVLLEVTMQKHVTTPGTPQQHPVLTMQHQARQVSG